MQKSLRTCIYISLLSIMFFFTGSISAQTDPIDTLGTIHSIDWSPDGTRVAISRELLQCDVSHPEYFSIFIVNVNTQEIEQTLIDHTCPVVSVDWSPDGTKLVTASLDPTILIWDVTSGQILKSLPIAQALVYSAQWNHAGNRLLNVEDSGSSCCIYIWNFEADKLVTGIPYSRGTVDWSPDDTKVVGGVNGTAGVWDSTTGELLYQLPGLQNGTKINDWSLDNHKIATVDVEGYILIWDPTTGQEVVPRFQSSSDVLGVSWSPSADFLGILTRTELVVWNTETNVRHTVSHAEFYEGTIAWGNNEVDFAYTGNVAGNDESVFEMAINPLLEQ